jgi:acyl dehydratase
MKIPPKQGERFVRTRTFTDEDIEAFTRVSGDVGEHHVARDAKGRLLAHGLLVATIPTQVGGQHDYLAREMRFEFLRPVYSGDTIECTVEATEVVDEPDRLRCAFSFRCTNQRGQEVVRGGTNGIIRKPPPAE